MDIDMPERAINRRLGERVTSERRRLGFKLQELADPSGLSLGLRGTARIVISSRSPVGS